MIAAVSADVSASLEPADEQSHWLNGRYFVPLPDLSDETRQAIYGGRAAAVWIEIVSRLRNLERRGPDDQTRQAAFSGRIESLGVNGLAAAVGCSHTTALKHLRHLESLGLIRTEQAEFTMESDAATGKIRRNYAKAPPKVIVVTIEDRHCRPCRASETRKQGTPGTGLRVTGDTPETGGKGGNPQDRNWRVSKERTSKEVRSFGTNRRRTAAGPQERPAAAVAGTERRQQQQRPAGRQAASQPPQWLSWSDPATCRRGREFVAAIAAKLNMTPEAVAAVPRGQKRHELIERYREADQPPDWQRQAEQEARDRRQQEVAEGISRHLGMPVIEVIGLWRASPDDLKVRCIDAGLMTPDGKFTSLLASRTPRQRQSRRVEGMPPPASKPLGQNAPPSERTSALLAKFVETGNAIMAIREQAEASGDHADLERARMECQRIVREYAKAEGKAVA
jgi:hypothetical protein